MSQDFEQTRNNQQQALGDVQVQGDDNVFNVIQGNDVVVTLNQTRIIQVSVDEIKTRQFISTSPYKGLRTFEPEDKAQFFGRDQFLTGLVNELEQTNLILLLGASGSGKSSVVRAGLIPWLSQKWGTRLVNLMLTPDQDPFETLYGSLLSRYKQSEVQFVREAKVDTLSHLVQTLRQPQSFWFLLIDQFEELFTTSDPEKRDRFISSLVQLSKEQTGDPLLKIVATMRSDFLNRLDPYPVNRLARATEKHRPLITQMHPDELRLAIEQPAAHHGVVYEMGLVETIIKDVQGQAGYLPLLQYTLDRLWETEQETTDFQQERMLCTRTYLRLGGVRGTLQSHVDHIYGRLQQEGKHLATQRIFLKLVEIGGDAESGAEWKPVRRRANRSEFKDELEKTVLAQLIDEKLIVSDRDLSFQAQGSAQGPTVEIAHEILLTSWTTLNTWIRENRQAIALRNRLNADVALWQLKKADSDLWSGAKLEKVAELRKDSTFTQVLGGFDPATNQFIDASLGKRNRELRFYRNVAVGAIIGLVCITGSLIFAGSKWRTADQDQLQAELTSSKALFERNPTSLDTLVAALQATTHLQHSLWVKDDSQLRAKAMETLAEAVYAVREHNRLEGHTGYVNSVSFSHDGQMIGTASFDKTAKLWSADGRELRTLAGHGDRVTDISFSPDDQTIATASMDGIVILWNRHGKQLQTLHKQTGPVRSVQFSRDGHRIATANDDGTVKLWDLYGHLIHPFKGHMGAVNEVRFSPKEKILATASADGTVKLWDFQGNVIHTFEGHCGQVNSVNFSPDGQTLVSGCSNKTAILWDRKTKARIRTLKGHTAEVNDAIFAPDSPDRQKIATASLDNTVRLWNRDGTLLETLSGHQDGVYSLSFNKNGNILASASNDRTVKLWQRNTWRTSFVGHHDSVDGVAISGNGQRIVSASADGMLKLWNLKGEVLKTLKYQNKVTSVDFSLDSKTIALTIPNEYTVKIQNLQGRVIKTLKELIYPIYSVNFSRDGEAVAFGSRDKTVKLWNYKKNVLKSLQGHKAAVLNVRFSPDARLIVSGDEDGAVKIWSREGNLLHRWQAHTGLIYSIQISPDNQTVATAGQDGLVKLWDQKGHFFTLEGHTALTYGIRFSLNNQMIATAREDGTVKLWTRNGELITTLFGHNGPVNSLSFTPDSKMLATVSADSTMLLWNVENLNMNSLMTRGCDWLKDDFKAHPEVATKNICAGIEH